MNQIAVLGGGCFWCLEAAFEKINGVKQIVSGYAGGTIANPSYEQVCSGLTGHAEVVQITFDDQVITYRELLELFFAMHDPTTPDRQGHDVGNEYRSIILTTSEEQIKTAQSVICELTKNATFPDPIVTEVRPLSAFYPAEKEHQGFYTNNPNSPYCRYVITPKLAALQRIIASS